MLGESITPGIKNNNRFSMEMKDLIILCTILIHLTKGVQSACVLLDDEVWTCNHIPSKIPEGTKSVHIKDFMTQYEALEINNTVFQSDSWQNIKYLKFTDVSDDSKKLITINNDTFDNFTELRVLQIHCDSHIELGPYSLSGLDKVKILDLSGCIRLSFDAVTTVLAGSENVPNLEQLTLSQIDHLHGPIRIDRAFSDSLKNKPVFHIDFSGTQILIFEIKILSDLNHLKVLNISDASIIDIDLHNVTQSDVQHVDMIDLSNTRCNKCFTALYLGNFTTANKLFMFRNDNVKIMLSSKAINLSNYFGNVATDVFINNITVQSVTNFEIWTKELYLMNNNIRRFDVRFICENFNLSSLERFNLANNGLEYVHPSILDCLTGLAFLDLSDNILGAMYDENIQHFNDLLKNSWSLKNINLAANSIPDIPESFFANNDYLEQINLAGNRLKHVHFKVSHLKSLRELNLANNAIKLLDVISIKYLDSLTMNVPLDKMCDSGFDTTSNINDSLREICVKIEGNPLVCNSCEKITFIRWVSKSKLIDTMSGNVTCKGESGESLPINNDVVTYLQRICDRKTRNVLIAITTVVISFGCVITCTVLLIRKRSEQKRRQRLDVTQKLRNNEFEFAVFLSFNSEDEPFVKHNVVEPLNRCLQAMCDTDRNLVCVGDRVFRLGHYVHNESLRCIGESVAFVCVVSDNYCASNYCVEEFNHALGMKKPVLLMMKEDVEIDLMTPAMQLLFKNRVRILWEDNNGEYILKTSWKNVCGSILDLASVALPYEWTPLTVNTRL